MIREAIGAVLLAAGNASRYGGPKQLVPIAGIPMLRRAALATMQCVHRVVVVTGAYRAEVQSCLADLNLELAFNAVWQRGMGSSIACGVSHLLRMDANLRGCMILLADQPLVTASDLEKLIDAHHRHAGDIIASRYGAKALGPPCLFPRRHFEELLGLEGPGGASSILRRHHGTVHAISNPRAGMDVDTPADLPNRANAGQRGAEANRHGEDAQR